jgi:serine/threonine-protein kinase/endoribonuclease IRE1
MGPIFPLASVALVAWPVVLAAVTIRVGSPTLARNAPTRTLQYQVPQVDIPPPDLFKDYDLVDIVLVASVESKFYALNRTSGRTIWSMSMFTTMTSVSASPAFSPLVRTTHTQFDSFDSNSPSHETYIIEPQSGDIYVLHSVSAPLRRLPFCLSELVEMSLFTTSWTGESLHLITC